MLWLALAPVQIACFLIVCFNLGNVEWWGGFRGIELILDTLLYPALIYLSFQLDVSSGVLSYLGSLSFGLYAFQCPADLLRELGLTNRYVLLGIIVGLAVAENALKRIIKHLKKKRESATAAGGGSCHLQNA